MQDEDVTKKSGIYSYILTNNEKYLSIRSFTDKQKRESYERQQGICPHCKEHFELSYIWNSAHGYGKHGCIFYLPNR